MFTKNVVWEGGKKKNRRLKVFNNFFMIQSREHELSILRMVVNTITRSAEDSSLLAGREVLSLISKMIVREDQLVLKRFI
jgi:hypothetical protein